MTARPRHLGQDHELLETRKKNHSDARLGRSSIAAQNGDEILVQELVTGLTRGGNWHWPR
jgi:hypothetical protein